MNSPSTNLAWHYPSGATDTALYGSKNASKPPAEFDSLNGHWLQSLPTQRTTLSSLQQPLSTGCPADNNASPSHEDVSLLLQLSQQASVNGAPQPHNPTGTGFLQPQSDYTLQHFLTPGAQAQLPSWGAPPTFWHENSSAMQSFGDMMIESQDVEMSMLGLDTMPWFDSYSTNQLDGLSNPASGTDADSVGRDGGEPYRTSLE